VLVCAVSLLVPPVMCVFLCMCMCVLAAVHVSVLNFF